MVQMRPLIGKQEMRNIANKVLGKTATAGTGAMDREEHDKDSREHRLHSVGRSTQFSVNPWMRTGGLNPNKTRQNDRNEPDKSQPVDMTIVGKKENPPQGRNMSKDLQRSQVIKQTSVNFPINLPIQTINMSM